MTETRNMPFTTHHAMVAAYHAAFDLKDEQEPGSAKFVRCGDICRQIAHFLTVMGEPAPSRWDKAR